jgi:hypothetical protein
MKTTVLMIAVFLIAAAGFTQKKVLIEQYDAVVETAKAELDLSNQGPEGELYLLKQKYDLKGTYTLVLQIHEKGNVASVFVKEKQNHDIRSQNMVKDFLKDFEFHFKMPKGKDYKFEYTIEL